MTQTRLSESLSQSTKQGGSKMSQFVWYLEYVHSGIFLKNFYNRLYIYILFGVVPLFDTAECERHIIRFRSKIFFLVQNLEPLVIFEIINLA